MEKREHVYFYDVDVTRGIGDGGAGELDFEIYGDAIGFSVLRSNRTEVIRYTAGGGEGVKARGGTYRA